MAKKKKSDLEKLQSVLGVDLMGDADIQVDLGDGRRRELRIRSLGSAAYDIWSADTALERKPRENLAALEELVGVELSDSATVDITPQNAETPLRIRSLGSQFYDIWTAADTIKKN